MMLIFGTGFPYLCLPEVSLLVMIEEKLKNEFNGLLKYFRAFHLKSDKTAMMLVYPEPGNICIFANFPLSE